MKIFTSGVNRNIKNNLRNLSKEVQTPMSKFNFTPKCGFASHSASVSSVNSEIKFSAQETNLFYPIKGLPQFKDGLFTVFEYSPPKLESDENGSFIKLPQVPYEIKEHALKGFIYTFFLIWGGRFISNFSLNFFNSWGIGVFPYIPAAVFSYQYLRPLYYMSNAISAIRLKEDGLKVVFEFKNLRKPLEVEISRITKGREESFLNECYTEPFLFPITIDYTDLYGEYSLKNKRKFYLYGDSHSCVKDGEILRAILNTQAIKLK